MSRNFHQLHLHLVFVTKHRDHLINDQLEKTLHQHLWVNAQELELFPIAINGTKDHLHLLTGIPSTLSVASIVKNLKGSSSRFANEFMGNKNFFQWSRGYGASTVSKKDIPMIKSYIRNQKDHHKKGSVKSDLEF